MLKIVIAIAVVLLIVGGGFFYLMIKGPDMSRYRHLQEPQITTMEDMTVLEVPFETSADGLKEVFSFLFKNYYKMKGVPKRPDKVASPVARYENALDFEMDEKSRLETFKNMTWKGVAAIPLPPGITELPSVQHDTLTARITTWSYGEMAEILYTGPYELEGPAVKRLMEHIRTSGYEVNGLHEEVYLRGPGTPFVKPENYCTIIRYPVKKK